jgi:ubiquitin carboxyl-terminal hydrolase 8
MSAVQILLRDLWAAPKGVTLRPAGFLHSLVTTLRECDDDWYQPRRQADAAECLQYILEAIHDAIYRPVRITIRGEAETPEQAAQMKALQSWSAFFAKEYSPIVEHLNGQTQIEIRCETCKNVSRNYEPWVTMKIPIPGGDVPGSAVPTMAECMREAYAPETIEEYQCDRCKAKRTATITHKISKLPSVLFLSFKRFTNTGSKIRGKIEWDVDSLDFRPWMAFAESPYDNAPNPVYTTFAVIEHTGSSQGGHYRMYGRTSKDTWAEYDDESVRDGLTAAHVVNADSYILALVPSLDVFQEMKPIVKTLKQKTG